MVSARAVDASAQLTVADTGQGIAPAAIPHLFERFYRADEGRNRAAGGTGLGLAIAQAIVRRHGGEIAVVSAIGEGSRFTVTLPGERVGDQARMARPALVQGVEE